ncbi:hypothetical protein [Aeromonas caviae]|uniref:hypothetical protein n=1 Tax=Aeromonas caviae TaxID=648 RepID=UPI00313D1D7A
MAKKPNGRKSTAGSTKQNVVWGIALVFIVMAGAYVVMGNMDQSSAAVATQAPVEIPPPAAMPTQAIKTKDISALSETERDLLQKAREYKVALLTSKINELKTKNEPAQSVVSVAPVRADYISPVGTPDDIPADPMVGSRGSFGDDIIVKMILGTESAWLERGGERRQVRVGGAVWGVKVSKITPDSVCVTGKRPRCLYIEG